MPAIGASAGPLGDVLLEAERVIRAACEADVPLRLLGGTAVISRAPQPIPASLRRVPQDIDCATTPKAGRRVGTLLETLGYQPAKRFNAARGDRRLLFHDAGSGRQLDVFVGEFSMCHLIPLAPRLLTDPLTIPLAELLLTKLQIVEPNLKDVLDVYVLLGGHEVGERDGETINADRIAELTAADWGLWRTVTGSLDLCVERLDESGLDPANRELVRDRALKIRARIDSTRKTLAWRSRGVVGEKLRWYLEPDEVGEAGAGSVSTEIGDA